MQPSIKDILLSSSSRDQVLKKTDKVEPGEAGEEGFSNLGRPKIEIRWTIFVFTGEEGIEISASI